jgi:hypothetical protein
VITEYHRAAAPEDGETAAQCLPRGSNHDRVKRVRLAL